MTETCHNDRIALIDVPKLDPTTVYACCNMCGTNISCKNGTGGLSKHIKSKHQGQMRFIPANLGGTVDVDIFATIKKRKVRDGSIATLWTKSSHSMAERKVRQLESTSLFLAMNNVATDVVESKYFRKMLKSYDSNAEPPSINKVKDHFRVLEANIRQAQLVTTSGGFVTITCDHWTSVP